MSSDLSAEQRAARLFSGGSMRKESKERKESAKRGVFTHNTLFTQLSVCAPRGASK
jgi:hypothetical protein